MARLSLTSALSRTFCGLFHGAPNRRARRALGWKASPTRPAVSSRQRVRPRLEALEERCLLSGGITSPTGLVNAIEAANNSGGPTTITLASGTTFDFSTANNSTNGGNALPVITGNITIVGNGGTIERTGAAVFRLFDVASGGSLTLQRLTLQDGLAEGQGTAAEGGAIFSSGTLLSLSGVAVQKSEAEATTGNANGGGIYYGGGGSVFLSNDLINTNKAVGSSGGFGGRDASAGNGGDGGNGIGGGVCVNGASGVTITNDTRFTDNEAIGGSGGEGGSALNLLNGVAGDGGTGGLAQGGGLYVSKSTTTPIISLDEFNANEATGGTGGDGGIGGGDFGDGLGNPGGDGGTGGLAQGGGLCMLTSTTTPIISLNEFNANEATGGNGGSGGSGKTPGAGAVGGDAEGGGLYVGGSNLTLNVDSISKNVAVGGNGGFGGGNGANFSQGDGGEGGSALGGGVFVANPPSVPVLLDTVPNQDKGTAGTAGPHAPSGNGPLAVQEMYPYAMTLTPKSALPPGTVGTPYTQTISALPAFSDATTAILSFNVTSSPLGLNFNTDGNLLTISGTPTAAGTVTFSVTAADSDGTTQPLLYSLTINPLPGGGGTGTGTSSNGGGSGAGIGSGGNVTLNVPPLLAFFDSLLGGVERVTDNGTETVTDSIFGIPLLVATYDSAGDLLSVTLFGINVTALFESL